MMKWIDGFLNRITMYRLVVYELIFLLLAAGVLGFFGVLSIDPLFLAFSVAVIFGLCYVANRVFAYFFDAPYNPESTWITALILALIIAPPHAWFDPQYVSLAFWASTWAIASKYLLAIHKKHIFNPAAFGVAVTALVLGLSANWWVGTPALVPFVLAGGLLIVRKIHRFDLWWAFIGVFFVGVLYTVLSGGGDIVRTLTQSFLYAPVFFFAMVMLTEPLTTPPTKMLQIFYGALVGFLFLPQVNIASFYFTPELALLAGNVFSYLVSPKEKLVLALKEKIRLSKDVFEFVFTSNRRLAFAPGQYMEWTLAHDRADSRSVRRYFTIASSPRDRNVRVGVKFYAPPSTFKRALYAMRPGDEIIASQLAGDFTLPRDKNKKLVFIAGGIGITPFRSMIEHLLETGQKRSVALLYSNKLPEEAVYKELFDRAEQEIGLETLYAFTGKNIQLPQGAVARIDAKTIAQKIPDYRTRVFYISGPERMVTGFKETLMQMGIKKSHIKTDYFPGFA